MYTKKRHVHGDSVSFTHMFSPHPFPPLKPTNNEIFDDCNLLVIHLLFGLSSFRLNFWDKLKIFSGIAAVQVVSSALPSASYHLIVECEQLVMNENIGHWGSGGQGGGSRKGISVIFKT